MTTRKMVDPELLPMLDSITVGEMTVEGLAAARQYMDTLIEPLESYQLANVSVEKRTVPGLAGAPEVPVTLYRPLDRAGPLPAYLNIHGGGYIMGTAAFNGRSNVSIAAEIGCLVVAVDYRVAPEAPAPAAVEDCYAALAWVHDTANSLGIDRTRVAIGGDSAGGGLAAALAILARDRGRYPICYQLLLYPMLDDRSSAREQTNRHVGEFIWTKPSNFFGWRAYLGQEPGARDVSPYHSPARATLLSGLPPAYIGVGALDLLLEEDVDYASRLLADGVSTELHVYPGAFHGFDKAPGARIAAAATREMQQVLARALS
jgi:acetyl esterase/lipase